MLQASSGKCADVWFWLSLLNLRVLVKVYWHLEWNAGWICWGLLMGGALAFGLQDPVKQAGQGPSSELQVLVELTELSHSAEQVSNTPSLLTCQLQHSVELRNKHTLVTSAIQLYRPLHSLFVWMY